MIEADSIEDAQKAIDDWSEDVDLEDNLPTGTEDLNPSPHCEYNDEGQRLVYLSTIDGCNDDDVDDDDDDDDDDFNDGEDIF